MSKVPPSCLASGGHGEPPVCPEPGVVAVHGAGRCDEQHQVFPFPGPPGTRVIATCSPPGTAGSGQAAESIIIIINILFFNEAISQNTFSHLLMGFGEEGEGDGLEDYLLTTSDMLIVCGLFKGAVV